MADWTSTTSTIHTYLSEALYLDTLPTAVSHVAPYFKLPNLAEMSPTFVFAYCPFYHTTTQHVTSPFSQSPVWLTSCSVVALKVAVMF